jgi:hypothetical protein
MLGKLPLVQLFPVPMEIGLPHLVPGATAGAVPAASVTAPVPKPVESATTKEEKQDLSEIQVIPARIVERLADGNYRVKVFNLS